MDATDRARSLALLGLCSLARGDWQAAHERFLEGLDADPAGPNVRKLAVLSVRAGAGTLLPRKNPALATALSIGIPGAGQVYAGRRSEGFRHLFFNGAMVYSIAKLLDGGHYPVAAALIGFEAPFYAGNVIGARNAAASFNRERRVEFVARTIERDTE